jgi:uncharacterized protein (TIGR02145 family)
MHIIKSLYVLGFLVFSFCHAESIVISGVVKDSGGVAISGATVFLEKAGLITTTGPDGRFTLNSDVTSIQRQKPHSAPSVPVASIHKGKLHLGLSRQTNVSISVYDVRGRQFSNIQKTLNTGLHSVDLLCPDENMHLYKIKIGDRTVTLKGLSIKQKLSSAVLLWQDIANSGLSSVETGSTIFNDTLVAMKEAYLPSRKSIAKPDTAGVELQLIKQLPIDTGTMVDIDGNSYKTVRIGNQIWTAENLRTSRYNDGTSIPKDTSAINWRTFKTPKYCYYNNTTNEDTIKKYGALYNWYVVKTRKLAPEGWHVPTVGEWSILQEYLIKNGYNWDGTTAENKVGKSLAAKTDWLSAPQLGSIGNDLTNNNRTGFSALPDGSRTNLGEYSARGWFGRWWSSTEYYTTLAYYCYLCNTDSRLVNGHGWGVDSDESSGFSVRLVKD